jgi:hypothetical protein
LGWPLRCGNCTRRAAGQQRCSRSLSRCRDNAGITPHHAWTCRTLTKKPASVKDLPDWNYDGSSTGQAPGTDSEVYLKPRAMYKDPFRGGDNILVMCDTYEPPRVKDDNSVTEPVPLPTNTRFACNEAMEKAKDEVRRCAHACKLCATCGITGVDDMRHRFTLRQDGRTWLSGTVWQVQTCRSNARANVLRWSAHAPTTPCQCVCRQVTR